MTYALVIPPEYLGDLVAIRTKSGKSIRKQILESIQNHIKESKKNNKRRPFYLLFLEKRSKKSAPLSSFGHIHSRWSIFISNPKTLKFSFGTLH